MNITSLPFIAIDRPGTKFREQRYSVAETDPGIFKLSIATLGTSHISPQLRPNDPMSLIERVDAVTKLYKGDQRYAGTSRAFSLGMRTLYKGLNKNDALSFKKEEALQDMLVYNMMIDTRKMKNLTDFAKIQDAVLGFKLSRQTIKEEVNYSFSQLMSKALDKNKDPLHYSQLINLFRLTRKIAECSPVISKFNKVSRQSSQADYAGNLLVFMASNFLNTVTPHFSRKNDIPLIATLSSFTQSKNIVYLAVTDKKTGKNKNQSITTEICPVSRVIRLYDHFNTQQLEMFEKNGKPLMDREATMESVEFLSKIKLTLDDNMNTNTNSNLPIPAKHVFFMQNY